MHICALRSLCAGICSLVLLMTMTSSGCGEASGTSDAGIGVIDRQLEAPGTGITGLAWGDGLLWSLDDDTDRVYAIDTHTGEIQLSFPVSHERSLNLTGLAYSAEHRMILVGLWERLIKRLCIPVLCCRRLSGFREPVWRLRESRLVGDGTICRWGLHLYLLKSTE